MRTLETERLILRDWKESDLDDLYEYASVEGVGEMAGWPHHESIETSKRILNDFINNGDVYAVELKAQDKVIGSLGIHNRTKDVNYEAKMQREIGYVLNKAYWGRGLMPEAVRAAIQYAFEEMGLDVLSVVHYPFNERSKRVIEKCGFIYEGTQRQASQIYNGDVVDDVCYSILRSEYET